MSEKTKLKEAIQTLIDAENTFVVCCTHLGGLIKNGKIRQQFSQYINDAQAQKKFLITYLEILGVNDFVLGEQCRFCKINPESFSLAGALTITLEITEASLKVLKQTIKLVKLDSEKKIFKRILAQKTKQRIFLNKEADFVSHDTQMPGCIGEYCIPQVIEKIV